MNREHDLDTSFLVIKSREVRVTAKTSTNDGRQFCLASEARAMLDAIECVIVGAVLS